MKNVEGKSYWGVGLDHQQFAADAAKIKADFRSLSDNFAAEGARIDTTFRNIARSAGIVFGLREAYQLTQSIVRVRGEMQMLEKSFGVLLQSEEKSAKMLAEIRALATESPLEMSHVSQAAQTLLGFGVEADRVMGIVRQLSDVSMGNSDRFRSLALVYAQTQAAGKLMGQDLIQMINAGFNPLQVISEKTGKSIATLKKEMESGAISAQMVADAFIHVTSEGGKFYQMTQKQAEGLVGLKASLSDAWAMALNDIGKSNEGIIASTLKGATAIVENYKPVLEILKTLVVSYGAYKAATVLTNVVGQSNANVRYNAEIQALQALITTKEQNKNADLQQMIADRQLTAAQVEKIAMLRQELAAQLEVMQAEIARSQASLLAARNSIDTSVVELSSRKAKVALLKEEQLAAIAANNAEKSRRIQRQIYYQEQKIGNAQTALGISLQQAENIQADINTKTTVVNSLQQNINNASKVAGATATNIFSAAQRAAATAVKGLTASIKANPFGWLLTAVMLAVQGLQSFKKASDESTDAAAKLSVELNNESRTYEKLLASITSSAEGSKERAEAIRLANQRYGDYLPSLLTEKSSLENITTALKDANVQMVENIRLKVKSAELTRIESERLKVESNVVGDLVKRYQKGGQRTPEEVAMFSSQMAKMAEAARNGNMELIDTGKILVELGEDAKRVAKIQGGYLSDTGLARRAREIYGGFLDIHKAAITAQSATDVLNALVDIEIPQGTETGAGSRTSTGTVEDLAKRAKNLADLRAQLADDAAQAEIDAKADGLEKTLAQNKLNHDREIAQIEQFGAELLAAYHTIDKNIKDLPAAEMAMLGVMVAAADTDHSRADNAARQSEADRLNALLKDYQTYQERMTAIAEKYAKEREGVTAAAGGAENISLVNEAEREAMDALNLEYAQKESTFRAWMNQLATQTLDELTHTLEEAEKALAEAEAAGGTGQGLAAAKARVTQARAAVQEGSERATTATDTEDQMKEWQKLYSTLQKVSGEFEEIGDQIGGTAGEAIRLAGTIATSTIAMIDGIKTVTGAAAASMTALEKASVILAVIGAAIQVVTAITGMFKDNEEQLRAAADAAFEYDQALKRIAITKQYDLFDTIFGEDALGKFEAAVKIAEGALDSIKGQVEEINGTPANFADYLKQFGGGVSGFTKALSEWDKANGIEAVFDGRNGWNKLIGSGNHKIKTTRFNVGDYFNSDGSMTSDQLEALREWYDAYAAGLDDAEKKTIESLIATGEEYVEAVQTQKDYVQGMFGDLASSIADNMIEAFLATGDAAENLGDVVDDVAKNMAKNIVSNLIFDKVLNGLADDVWALVQNDDYTGAANLIRGAVEGIETMVPELVGAMESVGLVAGEASSQREGSSRGFEAMSQNSANELNGRFTAFQATSYETLQEARAIATETGNIRASMDILRSNSERMLNHLAGIERNTDRLEAIENSMASVKSDTRALKDSVDDIALHGVKLSR